jgi:hypothetical protein
METAVVATTGSVMIEVINASGLVECRLNRFSRGVERLECTTAGDGITASKRQHAPLLCGANGRIGRTGSRFKRFY